MTLRLQDKVALVTGSTLGIGKAVARRFVAEGARVIANSHRDDEAAASLRGELGDRALFVQADIADAAAVQAMVARGIAHFGRVDILVNNAGMDMFTDPLKMTPDQWRRCFAVDLDGAWNCCRAVLPAMLERGAGSIVNIASVHGHKIIPGCFPYPVAKHALVGLTRSLGIEYAARGVRVNSISPGLILTERVQAWLDSDPAEARRQTEILPCKRVGLPEEVAYTALFLASDEARFINASDILIDGGRSQLYHD
jgi:NAD(P)-dependent dehydrogenase (short-subunit alcohol dehydrogenase family)